jgi:uncharacterized membrane protein YkoI
MKPFVSTLFAVGVCCCGSLAAGDGYLDARRLVREGKILPLERILERIKQVQPGQVLEVEFGGNDRYIIYEIELLDNRGTVWELKVDAETGEIIEQELED